MNNKGFTLIELLAVFAILAGISLIAVFGISSSLEKNDVKEVSSQEELAKEAAKVYFSLNCTNSSCCVKLSYLISNNYIVDASKVNKLNASNSSIKITNSDGKISYCDSTNCSSCR